MGKRSVRRRKAKIKAYRAKHDISKHTTAARAVDGQQEPVAETRVVLGDLQRGGVGKTSAVATIPLPDTTIVVVERAARTAGLLSSAVKGGTRKSDLPLLLDVARRYANKDPFKSIVVDTDTTGSTIASLVIG
ncbi:MAG TPA: hypothetical protein VFG15_18615, partial [Amycolatopsis sp.]|nr:hypothetical protein [Amycolatopsis sp.]